jgi:hypothetical protein
MKFAWLGTVSSPSARQPASICASPARVSRRQRAANSVSPSAAMAAACAMALTLKGWRARLSSAANSAPA